MASSSSSAPILEGVFAIRKPAAISSAQVIRDVQVHFDRSQTFQPWINREKARLTDESGNQKQKRGWRGRRAISVKMGHGGTLDPMATGVLILGLGSGTKQLNHFTTECVKSYETVVLFGAATDTYDTEGQVVSRAAYEHIRQGDVEAALKKFSGKIMQRPPIFSALRVQGKRLYEYAREGTAVPVEIKERAVEVIDIEMTEWMSGGTHLYQWPDREAEKEVAEVAKKVMHAQPGQSKTASSADHTSQASIGAKRKREQGEDDSAAGSQDTPGKKSRAEEHEDSTGVKTTTVEPQEDTISTAQESENAPMAEPLATQREGAIGPIAQDGGPSHQNDDAVEEHKKEATTVVGSKIAQPADNRPPCPAPACRIRMTVTSGFYVRSLCHDLGAEVGSLGVMASLVRTRQGDFELGKNVLDYDELQHGENVWGPRVQQMLTDWKPVIVKESSKPHHGRH